MFDLRSLAARVGEANRFLGARIRSADVRGACDEIARTIDEHRKYNLFRELFPAAWNASVTSFYRPSATISAVPERIAEFFEIVNRDLFPILDDFLDDGDPEVPVFTVRPLNIDFCCEDFATDDLRTSFVAGLMLFGGADGEGDALACLMERARFNCDALPAIATFPHDDVWTRPTRGRTTLYRNLLEIIDHSTGNPWLDSTWCQPPLVVEWNREALRFLADGYRDALARFAATEKLDRLIERDPLRILTEMIGYWNTGAVTSGTVHR